MSADSSSSLSLILSALGAALGAERGCIHVVDDLLDFSAIESGVMRLQADRCRGTSLFGGRGKPLHALLGGVLIATVFNGLGLMGVSSAVQDMATALVLVAAVVLDSLVRRRATAGVR